MQAPRSHAKKFRSPAPKAGTAAKTLPDEQSLSEQGLEDSFSLEEE